MAQYIELSNYLVFLSFERIFSNAFCDRYFVRVRTLVSHDFLYGRSLICNSPRNSYTCP